MLKSEFVIGATTAKHFYMQGRDYLPYERSKGRVSWAKGGCYWQDVKIVICRFLECSFHS